MFKKLFKTEKKIDLKDKNILVASLLIHAAKIDDNYTSVEKEIIKRAVIDLSKIASDEAEKLMQLAEKRNKSQIR